MAEPRFKIGDEVVNSRRGGLSGRISAIGPRHRLPNEPIWYSIKGSEPEHHARTFFDAFEGELEPA